MYHSLTANRLRQTDAKAGDHEGKLQAAEEARDNRKSKDEDLSKKDEENKKELEAFNQEVSNL